MWMDLLTPLILVLLLNPLPKKGDFEKELIIIIYNFEEIQLF